MKTGLILVCTLALTACGTVGNAVYSDDTLREKAAFALNTSANKVSISNRKGGVDAVHFTATVGGRAHQCYFTTAGFVSSDAICSGAGSATSSSNCNALTRAAGRCK